MRKTIRPGRRAHVPLGLIALGLIALWIFVGMFRGWRGGAWQPILIVVGLYTLWVAALWRRVLVLTDDGITCAYLMRKSRKVSWNEVHYSVITFWSDGSRFQILVFGASPDKPLLDIPLSLFDQRDIEFLLSLDELRIRPGAA